MATPSARGSGIFRFLLKKFSLALVLADRLSIPQKGAKERRSGVNFV
jgi:hypothetical protein